MWHVAQAFGVKLQELTKEAKRRLAGLKKLQDMLTKYQGILEMMEPENEEAAN